MLKKKKKTAHPELLRQVDQFHVEAPALQALVEEELLRGAARHHLAGETMGNQGGAGQGQGWGGVAAYMCTNLGAAGACRSRRPGQ